MINTFENACLVQDRIIFFSYDVNGLFELNLLTGQCEFISSINTESNSDIRLFGNLTYIDGKIILAPMSANDFVIYDTVNKTEKHVSVLDSKYACKADCKFFLAIPYKHSVYFIGHGYAAIVKLNLLNYKVDYYYEWRNEFQIGIDDKRDWFRNGYCMKGDKLLLPCCQKNAVLQFDLATGESEYILVGSLERRYSGICFDGEYYWLSPYYDHVIVKWNYEENVWEEIVMGEEGDSQEKYNMCYSQCFFVEGYIVVIPLYDYPTYIINAITGEINNISSDWIIGENPVWVAPIRGCFIYKEKLYVCNSYNSKIYILNIKKMCFDDTGWNLGCVYKKFFEDKFFMKQLRIHFDEEIQFESPKDDLFTLIMSLYNEQDNREKKESNIIVGKKIYRAM